MEMTRRSWKGNERALGSFQAKKNKTEGRSKLNMFKKPKGNEGWKVMGKGRVVQN